MHFQLTQKYFFLFFLSLILNPLQAQEPKTNHKNTIQGSLEIGIISTTGNTNTQFNYLRAYAIYDKKNWRYYGNIGGSKTEVDHQTVSQLFDSLLQSDYKLFNIDYLYFNFEYNRNRFAGYRHRASETVGYGYNFPKWGELASKIEFGLGAQHIVTNQDHSGVSNGLITRIKETINYRLSETTTLEQTLSTKSGETTAEYRFELSLSQAIVKNFALKTSYQLEYNARAVETVRKLDSIMQVIVVYNFDHS